MNERFFYLLPFPSPTTKATRCCVEQNLPGSTGLCLIFSIMWCQTRQRRKVCTGRRGIAVRAVVWKNPSLPR